MLNHYPIPVLTSLRGVRLALSPAPNSPAVSCQTGPPYMHFTFTCVPPGSGMRIALDRNLDGVLNGDE